MNLKKIETKLKTLYANKDALENKKKAAMAEFDIKIGDIQAQIAELEKIKSQTEKLMRQQEELMKQAEESIGAKKKPEVPEYQASFREEDE